MLGQFSLYKKMYYPLNINMNMIQGTVRVLERYLVDLERATENSVYTGRAIALGIGAAHSAALLINFGHYTRLPTDIVSIILSYQFACRKQS